MNSNRLFSHHYRYIFRLFWTKYQCINGACVNFRLISIEIKCWIPRGPTLLTISVPLLSLGEFREKLNSSLHPNQSQALIEIHDCWSRSLPTQFQHIVWKPFSTYFLSLFISILVKGMSDRSVCVENKSMRTRFVLVAIEPSVNMMLLWHMVYDGIFFPSNRL